jgi:alpha-mannosidase
VRAAVRVRTSYGSSRLETDWLLYAGARTLEARVSLDWHEHQKMLKFSFPVNVTAPQATYEVPYGNIRRENNGHEYPGQRWIDLTGSRGAQAYGLTVINDAKYGYDVSGNDMRISIARSAVYAQHNPRVVQKDVEYIWQDQGIQTFRMLLVPHQGDWRDAAAVRRAEEFTAPLPVMYQGIHPGTLKQSASFLSVDAGNVVVAAMKKAEAGGDLIIRCYETDGKGSRATIELPFIQRRWSGQFRPYEIKTLRVPMPSGTIREVNALEE